MKSQNGGEDTIERLSPSQTESPKLEPIREEKGKDTPNTTVKLASNNKEESSLTSDTGRQNSNSGQEKQDRRAGSDTEDSISNAYATYEDNDAMSSSRSSRKSRGSFERRSKIKKRKSRVGPRESSSLKSGGSASGKSGRSSSISRKSENNDHLIEIEDQQGNPPFLFPSLELPGESNLECRERDKEDHVEGRRFVFWMDLSIAFVGALIVCTTIAVRMLGTETNQDSTTPTPSSIPSILWYCGESLREAKCELTCIEGNNSDCPEGMRCFEGVNGCEGLPGEAVMSDIAYFTSFCGSTRYLAEDSCDKPCPRGTTDCLKDEECFEDIVTCARVDATSPKAYLSSDRRHLRVDI
mmetsp:Transcript_1591/g.1646  ORF Transcript_1591/g.1646 Transcript_1591/m.1646 type:complete len:354 (-) Transcript_1591:252-1313(-)